MRATCSVLFLRTLLVKVYYTQCLGPIITTTKQNIKYFLPVFTDTRSIVREFSNEVFLFFFIEKRDLHNLLKIGMNYHSDTKSQKEKT